ncbi:MAG: hypothetical protein QXJ17_02130 [Nitrososphaeria archaeon]
MTTKNRFRKRKGLSRVLTEMIFLLLASTTAIGAFSLYNNYSLNMSGTTKIIIEQADIIATQNKAYIIVKNVGTTNVANMSVTIDSSSTNLDIQLSPGKETVLTINTQSVVAGKQYTIALTALNENGQGVYTTTYTTTAKP